MTIKKIKVQNSEVTIDGEFISLTDMAKSRNPEDPNAVIQNWIRLGNSIAYLGLWEKLHNPDFNPLEFEGFRKEAGDSSFTLSPKRWVEKTNAIGIKSKSGRYGGGTFAHNDIAFEFGTWLSPEFKLYLIQEFQRLKEQEAVRQSLSWSLNRELAKANWPIHTSSVRRNRVLPELTAKETKLVYAEEGDIINLAVFGMTATEWRKENPELAKSGNMRDYAEVVENLVVANMETMNAMLLDKGISYSERLVLLRKEANRQFATLDKNAAVKRIQSMQNTSLGTSQDFDSLLVGTKASS